VAPGKKPIEVSAALVTNVGTAASSIISAVLMAEAGRTLDTLKDALYDYMGKNAGIADTLAEAKLDNVPNIIEGTLDIDYINIIDLLKGGIGQGVGGTHASLYENLTGTNALLQAYHGILHRVGIEPFVDRWASRRFRPSIPDPETAWILSRIGQLTEAESKEFAAQDGWSDPLITGLQKSFYQAPALPTLMDLLRRGLLSEADFKYLLKLMRLRDSDVDAITALKLVYLGTSDLAKIRSKELIPDGDYKEAMAAHGIGLGWSDVLREATYTQPSFDQSVELYWRGVYKEADLEIAWQLLGLKKETITALKDLTKLIPPAPDLIRMVVREAFLPEFVIPAPDVFKTYMTKKGYAAEWSDRYWTAHFEPIELRQAYENLWRGLWTKDEFMYALHIKDIHPRWREDIFNVAFGPPGVREMGYGYDTGLYTVEDITKYRRWGGLSPEDASKAAQAMVAYRTEAEREALRREAIADYIAGLDDETRLREKLSAIGGRPEIIDLWVSRAKYRESRDVKVDLVKIVKDQFVKGLMTEAELRSDLTTIGVVPARIDVHVAEAQTRKASYVREEKAEKKKLLTEAKVAQAWDLGLIGDSEYVSRVVELGYLTEDAQLLLDIQRTPRPVTPEEVERRRKAVTARINRIERTYERLIMRLDVRTGVTSSEIESLQVEMKETLDVIDFEVLSIQEDLAAITPEVLTKPIVEARARVTRRYELAISRVDRTDAATREELTSTEKIYAETLDVIDVDIAFLIQELPQDDLEASYKAGYMFPAVFIAELVRRGWSRVDAEASSRSLRK
jgi:hypothetical protein